MDLCSKLKMLRKIKAVTQKQLAIDLGASERGIQQYELGERKPTFEMTAALSEYFGVSANYLLGIGIFKNEELILKHRRAIERHIQDIFPTSFHEILTRLDDLKFLTLLDACVERIEFYEYPDKNQVSIMIVPKVPLDEPID